MGKMNVANAVKGRQEMPDRVLLYGIEGCGKSTWAASAPDAIFLPAESGSGNIDVSKFDKPECWQDVLDATMSMVRDPHDHKTYVIDTLDAIEPLLWKHICERDKKDTVEGYGYGKGYIVALEEWRVLLHQSRKWEDLTDAEQSWVIDHLHVIRHSQKTYMYRTHRPGETERTEWELSEVLEAGIQFLDNSRNKFRDELNYVELASSVANDITNDDGNLRDLDYAKRKIMEALMSVLNDFQKRLEPK